MLGKILKYEFKSTARIFVLLYPALLLVALLNALLLPMDAYNASTTVGVGASTSNDVMQIAYAVIISFTTFAYAILVIGTMIMTLVISVMRFYSLLGKEGYLWLTLPTSTNSHILGKLICSLVWFVASALVVMLSVGILLIKTGWIGDVPEIWAAFVGSGVSVGLWIALIIVTMVMTWLYAVLSFYAACAIGPNIIKSRLGGSVIAYLIIYCIEQAVGTAAMVLGALLVGSQLKTPEASYDVVGSPQMEIFASGIDFATLVLVGGSCALMLLLCVVLYFLTRYFMTRRLNLA
jgi:hypothetical protein